MGSDAVVTRALSSCFVTSCAMGASGQSRSRVSAEHAELQRMQSHGSQLDLRVRTRDKVRTRRGLDEDCGGCSCRSDHAHADIMTQGMLYR